MEGYILGFIFISFILYQIGKFIHHIFTIINESLELRKITIKNKKAEIENNKLVLERRKKENKNKEFYITYVKKYKSIDFNITHISNKRKSFHHPKEVILKTPSHSWSKLSITSQTLEEALFFDWKKASGIGLALGRKSLRAIDIDGCSDYSLIEGFLKILELPNKYKWVVSSGSKNGFHIIFYSKVYTEFVSNHDKKIKAFLSKKEFANKFEHLELRWLGHLVLPPSKHPSGNHYEYINCDIPNEKPLDVDFRKIPLLINKYCSLKVPKYESGFFLEYGVRMEIDKEIAIEGPPTEKKYIGYAPINIFSQTEPLSYPYVIMPNENSIIKFPKKGRNGRKGYKEDEFFQYLNEYFTKPLCTEST